MSILSNTTEVFGKVKRQVPAIDSTMGLDIDQGLGKLIELSELTEHDELRKKEFLILADQCKWVGMAPELAHLMSDRSQAAKPQEPFILGLSNWKNATSSYGLMLNGTEWSDAYERLNINPAEDGHTSKFMQRIVDSGKDIVFFVPAKLFSDPLSDVTRREMEWLLANPAKAGHVYLVFGGYDFISEAWFRENWMTGYYDRLAKIAGSMKKWVQVMFNPKIGH